MAGETAAKTSEEAESLRLGLVRMIPQLLWFALAAVALWTLSGPILRALDQGRGVELGAASLTLKIVEQRLGATRVPDRVASALPPGVEIETAVLQRIERSRRQLSLSAILWIDDTHMPHTVYERRALSALGIAIDPVRNVDEALALLQQGFAYDAIISDFDRPGDRMADCTPGGFRNAGCAAVQEIRRLCTGSMPPVIMYVSGFRPEYGTPPYVVGVTEEVNELTMLLLDAFERRPAASDLEAFVEQEERREKGVCARTRLPEERGEPLPGGTDAPPAAGEAK